MPPPDGARSSEDFVADASSQVRATSPSPVLQAFWFADIRGYTEYTKSRGNEAGRALFRKLNELAKPEIVRLGGDIENSFGDSIFATFSSLEQAIRAGLEVQRVISELSPPDSELRVGIGISSGDAVRSENSLHSAGANRAHRLCSSAGPGEVRVDAATVELAGALDGVSLAKQEPVDLKGFGPVESYLATASGDNNGPAEAAPALTDWHVSTALDHMSRLAPTEALKRALIVARAQIPEEYEPPFVLFWMASWPERDAFPPLSLDSIRRGIGTVSGSEATVFALLRYHDYARWNPRRLTWSFSSEQRDEHEPRFVHWEADRSGFVFQQSEQPRIAGNRAMPNYTAWYCSRVVDFVGQFYSSVRVDGPITLVMGLRGVQLRSMFDRTLDGDQSLFGSLDAWWWQTYPATDWRERSQDLALQFAIDLLIQTGSGETELNSVSRFVEGEFAALEEKRASVPG
jgi:class 3 adenylate cyclase